MQERWDSCKGPKSPAEVITRLEIAWICYRLSRTICPQLFWVRFVASPLLQIALDFDVLPFVQNCETICESSASRANSQPSVESWTTSDTSAAESATCRNYNILQHSLNFLVAIKSCAIIRYPNPEVLFFLDRMHNKCVWRACGSAECGRQRLSAWICLIPMYYHSPSVLPGGHWYPTLPSKSTCATFPARSQNASKQLFQSLWVEVVRVVAWMLKALPKFSSVLYFVMDLYFPCGRFSFSVFLTSVFCIVSCLSVSEYFWAWFRNRARWTPPTALLQPVSMKRKCTSMIL